MSGMERPRGPGAEDSLWHPPFDRVPNFIVIITMTRKAIGWPWPLVGTSSRINMRPFATSRPSWLRQERGLWAGTSEKGYSPVVPLREGRPDHRVVVAGTYVCWRRG